MKVKQKIIAGLVCAALSVTDIFSVGFSVSASELNQQLSLAVRNDEETEDSLQETGVSESKTDKVYPLEDAIAEDVAKIEETESETRKEESVEESTEDETEVQQKNSELEESVESEIESETQEQKTELENKSDSRKKIEKGELEGAYQFGDSPADSNGISTYSVNLSADTNISKLEEYLYQQMKAKNETIDVESYGINLTEIGSIVSGVINEHPDLYFINKGFHYSFSGNSTIAAEVILSYDDSLDDSAFQRTTKEALAVVKAEMSDLEKAVALHDYLAVNCEYDKERLEAGTIPDVSYSAYGVLVNRIAVCEGYALAYKYLLNQIGINCYMVTSKEMNHAWNLIELNGTYYQVDVTWDDPTWDLIGRARHEYMFRSDDDFVNKCKHHNWSVTKGSEVVDYKAVDTTYDTAFWVDCDSPLVLVDKDCYYTAFNEQKETGIIHRASLSDSTQKGTEICEIGEWTVWGNDNGYYFEVYSGLFQANNRLYFNDKTSIYSIDLDDIGNEVDKRTEFTADTTDGYIYGSAFCQGKVLYSLRQEPIISSKDTVLTADIEIEQPSEIPVEKIELDKKTLTLTVGSTAKLQAAVTPNDTTDLEVTWISSDDAIAKVENGTVTAIASGSCTITASAGGKTVSCDVTVNELGEDIASGSYKDITWVIDANGKLTVEGTGDFSGSIPDSMVRQPWYSNREYITSAEINVTDMTDASRMFRDCTNLISVDLKDFDTSQVIDMHDMFSNCTNLISVDLKDFNTSQVTNMGSMFYRCGNLTSLDVSRFDTSKVTSMFGMFNGCGNLTSLDVSGFDTSQVTSMDFMFEECGNLTSIDVSGFDTSQVISMVNMFKNCKNLTSIDVSGFDTSQVTNMGSMFYGCGNLTSLDVSRFDTSKVTFMALMFNECGNLTSLDVSRFDTSQVTNMGSMFYGCGNLTSLDVSGFNTENVSNMGWMFTRCNNLTSLDVSNFDMGNVTDANNMFSGCSSLVTIYTPYNIKISVKLPVNIGDVWYWPDGLEITELPQNLSYSIMVTKKNTVSDDNIASGSYKDITWVINADGKLTVTGTGDFSNSAGNNRAPWYGNCESITSAEIKVIGMTDASYMFYNCENLLSVDLGGFNTSQVTNMEHMFHNCKRLENVDVSSFDTKNVTRMWHMFCGCRSLISIDVSSFDTKNVTSMGNMFYDCRNLASIDVSGFDVRKVTDMQGMFYGCSSLTNIDLSGFDTENVTITSYMFSGCRSLVSLDVSGFNTKNVTNMGGMFENCSSLTNIDVSNFDVGKVQRIQDMFSGCSKLTTIYTPYNLTQSVLLPTTKTEDIWYQPDGTVITELPQKLSYSIMISKNNVPEISDPYIIVKKAKIVYECGDVLNIDDLTVKFYNTDGTVKKITDYSTNNNEIDMSTSGTKTLKITYNDVEATVDIIVTEKQDIASGSYKDITWKIDADGKLTVTGTGDFSDSVNYNYNEAPWYENRNSIKFAEINVSDMKDASVMFYNCKNLVSVDVEGFDTSSITDMSYMFYGCSSLTSIDVSGFDTGNVTDMRYMFGGCSNLISIDLSGFDTGNVTDMQYMFGGCSNLTDIDLSGFDTSNVTDMFSMFSECSSLTNIDVSGFNVSKVTDMESMFSSCNSLTSIDVSDFDTNSVINMCYMFSGCNSLTSIDVSGFDTGNVTSMQAMFFGCSSLTSIDVSGFDTRNVTEMCSMFEGCSNLTSIDVRNFDTGKATSISCMFFDCSSLTSLDLSSFDTSQVTDMDCMIRGCSSLMTIYTPYNLTQSVSLPTAEIGDVWYQPDGTVITELPRNLSYSIIITKNSIPTMSDSYITVQKTKTIYIYVAIP